MKISRNQQQQQQTTMMTKKLKLNLVMMTSNLLLLQKKQAANQMLQMMKKRRRKKKRKKRPHQQHRRNAQWEAAVEQYQTLVMTIQIFQTKKKRKQLMMKKMIKLSEWITNCFLFNYVHLYFVFIIIITYTGYCNKSQPIILFIEGVVSHWNCWSLA